MGRLSQAFDFLKRKPLPPPFERRHLYTKISEEAFLLKTRKKLSLKSSNNLNEPHEDNL